MERRLQRRSSRDSKLISLLEGSILLPPSSSPSLPDDESETLSRLSTILRAGGVNEFCFMRVAPDYYDYYAFEVILDEAITKLRPDFFWLGGGEIDLKLGVRTSEFINFVKPFIVPCS